MVPCHIDPPTFIFCHREHIFRDLRPYMCTYIDCPSGDQLYDSWKDWASHERWTHNKIWRCTEHSTKAFSSRLEFEQHLTQMHAQKRGWMELNNIVSAGETVSTLPDHDCPFCLHTADSLDALQNHIATHLQRVALFALPRSTDLEDGSSLGDGASGQANVQDSRQDDMESVIWSDDDNNTPSAENEDLEGTFASDCPGSESLTLI